VFRRILFQLHLWTGVALSAYLLVVGLSGIALLFRPELQRWAHPGLFAVSGPATVDAAAVIDAVVRAYPNDRFSGVDAPTTTRATWLAYVVHQGRYRTVLIDPQTADVRGELPERSPVRTLQALHFDLLAGATGRMFNGVGAGCLLMLSLSGAILWWPGARLAALRQRLRVDFRRGWRSWTRELHALAGLLACAILLMWSVSGVYFAFPKAFRTGVAWITPLAPRQAVQSPGIQREGDARLGWPAILAAARAQRPDLAVARVAMPASPRGAVEVLFSRRRPTPSGGMGLESVFVDAHTGRALPDVRQHAAGETFMNWLAALHVGNFGDLGVRIIWSVFGLAPPLLAISGLLMWRIRATRTSRLPTRPTEPKPRSALEANLAEPGG